MSKSVRISKWGFVVLLLVVVGLTIGATVATYSLTDNFTTNIFVNRDNLIHTLDEYETKEGTTGNGISWNVDSFGRIKVNGKLTGEAESAEFKLGTVTVEKEDYYTLSGAPDGTSFETFYIKAVYETASGSTVTLYADITDACTTPEKLPEGTTVDISIIVLDNYQFDNYVFSPTFVIGKEAGNF